MLRCQCLCVCCDTQVFLVEGSEAPAWLRCPGCNRDLLVRRISPFGDPDWPTCTDPDVLAQAARNRLTGRKRRLFGCACCRLAWDHLPDPRSRFAVEVAERLADGLASPEEVVQARETAWAAASDHRFTPPYAAWDLLTQTPTPSHIIASILGWHRRGRNPQEAARISALFRDIVANPFRPPPAPLPPFVLACSDGTVVNLARGIYEERAFDRLPILADALEEAGCADPALLAHCRSPGPHVNGCWAVDLLLGKQ
jgi:hypothetical protein